MSSTFFHPFCLMSTHASWTASPLGLLPGWGIALLCHYSLLHLPTPWGYALVGLGGMFIFTGLYIGASRWVRQQRGEAMRGAMIGLSSGLNGSLWVWLTGQVEAALLISLLLSASAFLWVSRHPWYHALLGWGNWLLPLSWPVNLPGALMLLVNLLFAPLGQWHPALSALQVRLLWDPASCTLSCVGGLIRPMPGFSGLNMGNFIFINPGWEHLRDHEIGHLFSLAAMGAPFHYVGGLDEGLVQRNYWEAYAEYLADSYSTPTPGVLSVWR